MSRRAALSLALLGLLGLSSCQKASTEAPLLRQVMFTVSGSHDAQADLRDRLGGGLRRVQWVTKPPLPARQVTVLYDSDARPLAWQLELVGARVTASELAGAGATAVPSAQGQGYRPAAGSRLEDVLVLPTAEGVTLLTRGYAAQRRPELLPAFARK